MAEEIGFENGRNSNFEGLVTLTLDPVIRHTVVYHSSTSTYIPNFIEIEETFCGQTDGRTHGRTEGHFSPSNIIRSTFGSRPKNTATRRNHSHVVHTVTKQLQSYCCQAV